LQPRDRRHNTPKKSPTPHELFWYHWRFGDKAGKCIPPCSRQHGLPPTGKLHQQMLTASRVAPGIAPQRMSRSQVANMAAGSVT